MNSIMIAIAMLCQVPTGASYFIMEQNEALTCQKYYVNCWKQKRESQRKHGVLSDGDELLMECTLERKI